MAESICLRSTLRDQRADCLLLLLDLRDRSPEVGNARVHFGNYFCRCAVDELAVAQLAFLFAEVLLRLRLALL
jgi:hypothetical protein